MDEKFNMFMETVDERFRSFVSRINEYLTENGCKCDIKLQKSEEQTAKAVKGKPVIEMRSISIWGAGGGRLSVLLISESASPSPR